MFYCFYNPPSFDMDYGIFNVHTDVNARHCTRVCTGTVRESALKIDFRIKISCMPHWWIEYASPTCRSDALSTELHPHPIWRLTWLGFHCDPCYRFYNPVITLHVGFLAKLWFASRLYVYVTAFGNRKQVANSLKTPHPTYVSPLK